jgi:hypothetical protein
MLNKFPLITYAKTRVGVEKTSLEKTTGFNRLKPDRKTQAF